MSSKSSSSCARANAWGKVSADQSLSANTRSPAARTSRTICAVSGLTSPSISGQRSQYAAIRSRVLRMLALQLGDRFGEGLARIHLPIPGARRHVREKALHAVLVAGKERAVEVARVPVDEHAAQIEYRRVERLCCHGPIINAFRVIAPADWSLP